MKVITKKDFDNASPYEQGYAVYMVGCREDQPNVPDEDCPYAENSADAEAWHHGQRVAVIDAQDSEE